jgi:molybdopterin molybdotransferase
MPEFLELLPPAEALRLLLNHLPPPAVRMESIPTSDALGRVTAAAVIAQEPLPAFSRSTVDGFAVRAADTFGASDTLPAYFSLVGEVPMGRAVEITLHIGQAAAIHTGGMLPEGADAVVMLENTQSARLGELEVLRAVAVGDNILNAGEDVRIGQEVLPAGVRLRPAEIGGLMALGLMEVPVAPLPRVAILSSGDEVIPPDQRPEPGQVRDINSYSLSALVEGQGGLPVRYGIIPDQARAFERILAKALDECDAVIITAGSSASTRDLTSTVVEGMGPPGVLVHGVNVRPGKPTILAVCKDKPVIGLPGNPVSALVIATLFVNPIIARLLGIQSPRPPAMVTARLTINLASQAGREDWIPVKLQRDGYQYQAEPVFFKSNLIFNLAKADGLAHIPADATGRSVGEWIDVILLQ